MVNLQSEKIFYNYLRKNPELFDHVKPLFFNNEDLQECLRLDLEFYNTYKKVPSPLQIEQLIQGKKIDSFLIDKDGTKVINKNKIENIFEDIQEYENQWMDENIKAWIVYQNLQSSLFDASKYMKVTDINHNNIYDSVNIIKDIINQRNNIDFNFNLGSNFFDPNAHYEEKNDSITTGYSWLDDKLDGGWQPGTLIIIQGVLKSGKSIWCTNCTANAIRNGFNTAYISLEMSEQKVIRRLGANLLQIPMGNYYEFSKDPSRVKEKLGLLENGDGETLKAPGKLWIKAYPASTASTNDIEEYLKKVEEINKIKFKLVVVDYVNIMKNWRNPNTENTYMKIKQIAEDLRAIGSRNDWAILSVTQMNRGAINEEKVSIKEISESLALAQTADAVFATIQTTAERDAGIFVLQALALRESGGIDEKQNFNIDYDYMKITQNSINVSSNDIWENL